MQQDDPRISPILNRLKASADKPLKTDIVDLNSDTKCLWGQWDSLTLQNQLLYRKTSLHVGGELLQLIAPEAIREEVFSHLHTKRTAGHFGRDKTQQSIKRRFYWPGMSDSVPLV